MKLFRKYKMAVALLLLAIILIGVAMGNDAGIVVFVTAGILLGILGIIERLDFDARFYDEMYRRIFNRK